MGLFRRTQRKRQASTLASARKELRPSRPGTPAYDISPWILRFGSSHPLPILSPIIPAPENTWHDGGPKVQGSEADHRAFGEEVLGHDGLLTGGTEVDAEPPAEGREVLPTDGLLDVLLKYPLL